MISPGPGHPENFKDFGVCQKVLYHSSLPLLGVCLGHQGLAHYHGGIIEKAPVPMHGRLSWVEHQGKGLFQDIPSPFQVVRYHSLCVNPKLPERLEADAWASDQVLMGIHHKEKPFWGVQFHPESIASQFGLKLIENFKKLTIQFYLENKK